MPTSALLLCRNHAVIRWGKNPDGVCLVVGGCARGFDPAANTTADIIYTNGDMQRPGTAAAASSSTSPQGQLQYFWEAFPAADGFLGQPRGGQQQSVKAGEWKSDARTTYMFSYMDAQVGCVFPRMQTNGARMHDLFRGLKFDACLAGLVVSCPRKSHAC
jgi:hypothetical protein